MKRCNHCKETKELSEFHKNASMADGLQRTCKACKNGYYEKDFKQDPYKYAEKGRAKRKKWADFVDEFKSVGCSICPENAVECMDFHHRIASEKEFNISKVMKSTFNEINRQRVLDEIAKCDVVCSNCHRKIHKKLRGVR